MRAPWTHDAVLPGGDFAIDGISALRTDVLARYPWLPKDQIGRMTRAYGTRIYTILGTANSLEDLGRNFGGDLYEAEVRYMRETEFAKTPEDILWRRSKLGLKLNEQERAVIAEKLRLYGAAQTQAA
jgi:glycerol-3-phosphate dehydrogenase